MKVFVPILMPVKVKHYICIFFVIEVQLAVRYFPTLMFTDPQVDPEPYYHACVQESCSCEFEGKFLGFCTAVAAYAEACSDQDVCIDWRTPDMCRKL